MQSLYCWSADTLETAQRRLCWLFRLLLYVWVPLRRDVRARGPQSVRSGKKGSAFRLFLKCGPVFTPACPPLKDV